MEVQSACAGPILRGGDGSMRESLDPRVSRTRFNTNVAEFAKNSDARDRPRNLNSGEFSDTKADVVKLFLGAPGLVVAVVGRVLAASGLPQKRRSDRESLASRANKNSRSERRFKYRRRSAPTTLDCASSRTSRSARRQIDRGHVQSSRQFAATRARQSSPAASIERSRPQPDAPIARRKQS